MIELELPYPPSTNRLYRRVGPRTILSKEGRTYRDQVRLIAAASRVTAFTGPVQLELLLYPPDRRRRDADNSLKALCDALEKGGAYEDDSQIVKLTVEKKDPVPGGRAIVRIREAEA